MPKELNEDRLCYEDSLHLEEWPWTGIQLYVTTDHATYSLCKNIRSNFSLHILSYMHDISIPTKDLSSVWSELKLQNQSSMTYASMVWVRYVTYLIDFELF